MKTFKDYLPYFSKYGRNCMLYSGPNPSTPEEALLISIAKWTILSKDPSFQSDGGSTTCGYCMYYKNKISNGTFTIPSCRDCPIYAKTKQTNCYETPYREWSSMEVENNEKGKLKAAKKELKFLKSFLTNHKKRVKQTKLVNTKISRSAYR